MGPEENKAIVRRLIEQAFNRGDLAVIDELVARDYVSHVTPTEARGPAGLRAFVTMYRTAFPDYVCTVEDQVAEEDRVVTRWTARGTQRGELMGILPTDKPVILPGIVLDRLIDGQLVETWLQADVLGMLQQLGVMQLPEPTGV